MKMDRISVRAARPPMMGAAIHALEVGAGAWSGAALVVANAERADDEAVASASGATMDSMAAAMLVWDGGMVDSTLAGNTGAAVVASTMGLVVAGAGFAGAAALSTGTNAESTPDLISSPPVVTKVFK
jgi:hypothetical protein